MKQYRLKKSLPNLAYGAVFKILDNATWSDSNRRYSFDRETLENESSWFEPISQDTTELAKELEEVGLEYFADDGEVQSKRIANVVNAFIRSHNALSQRVTALESDMKSTQDFVVRHTKS